jgi:hypothetical protein
MGVGLRSWSPGSRLPGGPGDAPPPALGPENCTRVPLECTTETDANPLTSQCGNVGINNRGVWSGKIHEDGRVISYNVACEKSALSWSAGISGGSDGFSHIGTVRGVPG